MSGPSGVLARWSVAPAEHADSGRLVVVAPAGRAVVTMPAGGGAWHMELQVGGQRADRQWPADWNPTRASLEQLRSAIAGSAVHPDWLDAARSIELTQTIDRSLARGRTIELHHEEYNEAGNFKSLMAAGGCGLLLVGLCCWWSSASSRTWAAPSTFSFTCSPSGPTCCWHCWQSSCCCSYSLAAEIASELSETK